MSSGRQETVQNDYAIFSERSRPPPVPPRSQPATGSLFTAAVPSLSSFTPSFSPTSSVPIASGVNPGIGFQPNPYPPDPLLGGYSQVSNLGPALPPRTYMTSEVSKRSSFPGSHQAYTSLGGAYHQPPPQHVSPPQRVSSPQRVSPPARHSQPPSPLSSKDAERVAQLRVQHMENLVSRLQKEKKAMDEEFGRQRKKFMNQMMQTESELNLARQLVEKHADQIEEVNKLLLAKGEEVTSLKQRLEEAEAQVSVVPETSATLNVTKRTRSRSPRSPFDRRSPSPSAPKAASVNFTSENSLEVHMVKAAEDAKLLRSVVVPYEEEIDMLKMKLNEAEERLKIYEGKESAFSQAPTSSLLCTSPSFQQQYHHSLSSPDATSELPEVSDSAVLEKLLSQEQVARTDLERHVESLGRQKSNLQRDLEAMAAELKQVKVELHEERIAHTDLRETWDKANVHFLSTNNRRKEMQQHDSDVVDGQTPTPLSEMVFGTGSSPTLWRKKRVRALSWDGSVGLMGRDGGGASSMWEAIVEQLQKSVMRLTSEVKSKTELCQSYEKQMQRVQEQLLREIEDKDLTIDKQKMDMIRLEETILNDRKNRAAAQRTLLAEMEDVKAKIDSYQTQENKMRKKIRTMSDKFTETKHEVQKEVTRFSSERINVKEQLDQVREEYKCLKQMQTSESSDYRAHLARETQFRKEAEMNLKAAMEEISNLQADKDVTETAMANQLSELQQQLSYARQERQRLEMELGVSRTELAEVLRAKSNLEAVKNEALDSHASIREKSRMFIEQQQQKMEELVQQKESAEQTVDTMRKQVSVLKQQLYTSEANQRDFVELSQSLQVKLVEMEEARRRETAEDRFSNSSSPTETASLLPP